MNVRLFCGFFAFFAARFFLAFFAAGLVAFLAFFAAWFVTIFAAFLGASLFAVGGAAFATFHAVGAVGGGANAVLAFAFHGLFSFGFAVGANAAFAGAVLASAVVGGATLNASAFLAVAAFLNFFGLGIVATTGGHYQCKNSY